MRDLIVQKLAERRLKMREVSLTLGKNHAYLQQFLERDVPKTLPEEVRGQLAGILGVPEDALRGFKKPGNGSATRPARQQPAPQQGTSDRINILGMGGCSDDGWSLWNGDTVGTHPRPPGLQGVPSGFAVYAVGESMEPRYHPGELIYVHPGKPPDRGSYVLVQIRAKVAGDPPRAVIKRLVKQTATKLVLEQFNPAKTFEISASEVISMYRVVGAGEA